MADLSGEFYQAIVNMLVILVPVIVGIIGVWLVGKATGLWALIKNELLKRRVKQFASKLILESDVDEMIEATLEQWNDILFERAERYLKRKGIQVELDELEEVVADVIRDVFVYLEEVVEDHEPVEEEPVP